ncbi:VanZ family protein [Kitasatospora sp. NPDC094015]|uniref:VanZ family protein n=1 Tax=Kitasatospora sp. NPDC094015 TaxID=3155205 RepID=UPI00331D696D
MHRHGTTTRAEDCGAASGDEPTDPAPRREVSRPLRTVVRLLLAAHLLLLGWLSLRPLPVSWTYPANLSPFASVQQAFALGGWAGARQLAGGLLPLAPFGALLPLAGERLRTAWLPSLLRTAGVSALLATGLEIAEGWAPGHVLNVDDILLGTLGAAACHLAVVPAVRALLLRERPVRAAAAPPAAPAAEPAATVPATAPGAEPEGRWELPRVRQPYERGTTGTTFRGLSHSGSPSHR